MCGRFAFHSPHETVVQLFLIAEPAPSIAPSWNITPTRVVAAVRGDAGGQRSLVGLRWGLVPAWAKDVAIGERLINARAETLAEKPSFRTAFRRRRCLVLADGWYEWRAGPAGKQPYYIRSASGEPFGMAGLWESWRGTGEAPLETCVIITRPAAESIRPIHERMPALIGRAAHGAWLDPHAEDPAALAALLAADPQLPLAAHPVSRRVNSPRNDDPELTVPAADKLS